MNASYPVLLASKNVQWCLFMNQYRKLFTSMIILSITIAVGGVVYGAASFDLCVQSL